MSESSLSSATPSHATLDQALRDTIQQVFQSGNLDELTIRRVRVATEKRLGLGDGFYKNDPLWKEESKRTIEAEVEAHNDVNSVGNPSNSQASNQTKTSSTLKEPKGIKSSKTDAKRNSTTTSGSKKRKSKEIDEPNSDVDHPKAKVKRSVAQTKITRKNSPAPSSDQEKGDVIEPEPALQNNTIKESPDQDSESEMSVVIDEKPKRKSKTKEPKSGSAKPRTTKVPKSQASKKADDKPVDANADEIKRLQGWLIKCGIRKMWYRELAPYDTPKLKIQHLKQMLSDAGMTGRYSIEKATQIRNERELKAELEAVQEGDKQWGKNESDEEEGPAKPRKRRLAKGLKELDMIFNGSNGEETD